ncbi:MAG TPA: substrate-binding domain-containing protein [Tepidisphaeraceae bacterium]|jgi:D-xylose transport system substrate-binding protein
MHFKTVLVVVSLLLSVAIGLALRGSGAVAGVSRKPKIGLSLDTLKEARWQMDRDNFVARCTELGADVRVESANSDDNVQIQNVTGLLTGGVDVLVVAAHNGVVMAKAVEMAHAQTPPVPVIAYDRLIMNSDVDLYMSFDNLRVGQQQGQFIVDSAAKSGKRPFKIVRIYGSKTDNNALLFKQGQDQALKPAIDSGAVQVLLEDWAEDWKPENGKKIVNAAVTRFGKDIDAVLASNDGTAGGAIQALSEEGLSGRVLVTGQDAELVACQRMVQGSQSMSIYKPLKQLAGRAAEIAVAMANRKPVTAGHSVNNGKVDVPAVLMDSQVVTRDDLEATVVKDGMFTREQIFGK